MSIIGNTPRYSNTPTLTATGDGVTQDYTLSTPPGSINALIVFVGGVHQRPGTDFTLSTSTTLHFVVAPLNGVSINVYILGISGIVGAPADGSITTSKLAAGIAPTVTSVTYPDGYTQISVPSGFNRIINGAMEIDQRNAGASVSVNDAGPFSVDRWQAIDFTPGAFSIQQVTDAPTGFVNSIKVTTTTAGTANATDVCTVRQNIEGVNVADLSWGTANAQPVTLSFRVKSSLTGTFGGALQNSATNRSYPFTYTINAAGTWETKMITIAGDTTGTWLTTTGIGIGLYFDVGSGTSVKGAASSWAGANYIGATGSTNIIGTLNATWYVTGVQLERGTQASPFARRPYGTELALCQRYLPGFRIGPDAGNAIFGNGYWDTTTSARFSVPFKVPARAKPTGITSSGLFIWFANNTAGELTSVALNGNTSEDMGVITGTTTALTQGIGGMVAKQGAGSYIFFTGCEL